MVDMMDDNERLPENHENVKMMKEIGTQLIETPFVSIWIYIHAYFKAFKTQTYSPFGTEMTNICLQNQD